MYWDRDGFCGHEVVGTVVESKSARFAVGDAVLALPSSYFVRPSQLRNTITLNSWCWVFLALSFHRIRFSFSHMQNVLVSWCVPRQKSMSRGFLGDGAEGTRGEQAGVVQRGGARRAARAVPCAGRLQLFIHLPRAVLRTIPPPRHVLITLKF